MKFSLEYPSEMPNAGPGILTADVVAKLASRAEEHGIDAVGFSDHPARSPRWRRAGGHDTLEPAIALSFVAGATSRIRPMTYLYVLPFRNPYLAAKTLTSLDIRSDGRLIAAVGAGHLRSEFSSLGVDFEHRAGILDRNLGALTRTWANPEEHFRGHHFAATAPLALAPSCSRLIRRFGSATTAMRPCAGVVWYGQ
jgi:alkanesulfonate monooxygenase SsuD/methylene tetrahydromethanopterin reductase-like flavin-dependent oxidoreductase (luciferase family)